MKTTSKTENTSPTNSPSPSSNKSEKGTFFSKSKEVEKPFFPPNPIQPKLTINQPNDKYEQEADAVSDQVMRMKALEGASENEDLVQTKPLTINFLQRKCTECEEGEKEQSQEMEEEMPVQTKLLMRTTVGDAYTASPQLSSQLNSNKGGGDSLPEQTLSTMNQAFGADFSKVRIHTGSQAAEMNQGIQAKAFTNGSDIYFNRDEYNPESAAGKKLLAHELVHTIQQGQVSQKVQKKQQPLRQGVEGQVSGLSEEEISRTQTNHQIIQRATNWAAGNVHETINLADTVLTGAPNPVTWEMLNGTMLKSHAIATAAIKQPTISTYKVTPAWKAKVTAVPMNEGSFDETVVMRGPWTKLTNKALLGAAMGLAKCTGVGNTTFRAKGDPNDNHVFNANRRHEDHHARDHKAAFNAIIKTWDTKVTKAKNAGTEFGGADAATATANLWAAMGGTPANRAIAFNDECGARGLAFHGTAKGGKMGIANPNSDATCANSWVEVTNPS